MRSKGIKQAFRFGLVGILNTAVDYIVFYIMLTFLDVDKSISQFFATAVAMCGSYIANKNWTFGEKGRANKRQIVKFIATNMTSMAFTIIFMNFFHDILHIHEWVNNLLGFANISFRLNGNIGIMFCKMTASCLSLMINFFGNKFWVFNTKKSGE